MTEKTHKRGVYWRDRAGSHWEDARPGVSSDPELRWPYCYCGTYANKCAALAIIEGRIAPPHSDTEGSTDG